ncbi:MAG: HDIG domain-containing protein [Candidatus Schekmanbacteria bacterium]|nr:HDIG domain-containing protein [Candidatus Schekmanbacteria bacterium]
MNQVTTWRHSPGSNLFKVKKLMNLSKITFPSAEDFLSKYGNKPILVCLGLITALVLAFLLSPALLIPSFTLSVGDISQVDIKAPADFSVEDEFSTRKRQNEALTQVLPIFDFEQNAEQAINKIEDLFHTKTNLSEEKISDAEKQWNNLKSKDVLPVSLETFLVLQNPLFDTPIKEAAKRSIRLVMVDEIVDNKELLSAEKNQGIIKRNIKDSRVTVVQDTSGIRDVDDVKQKIAQIAPQIFKADDKSQRAAVEIAQLAVAPNLFFNKSATEKSKADVMLSVKPVYFQIKKGEMIVREGERVREDQVLRLNALTMLAQLHKQHTFFIGAFLLISVLLLLMYQYLKIFRPKIVSNPTNIYLFLVILLITFSLTRFFIFISNALSSSTPDISVSAYSYAVPFALGGLLVAILADAQFGMIYSFLVGILAAIQMGNKFIFFFPAAIGSIAAVFGITHIKQRTALLKVGLKISAANVLIIVPVSLMQGKSLTPEFLHDCLGGIVGGVLVATLASALVPLLEMIFKVTTDIRLLELSDMNQPLLKRLALEAPGTYQHSIVVGTLAEAAAEAVGANPLLVRIAAYYHDIGKISKAEYYIENQIDQENKHLKLTPSMSNLIIVSHIKEGLELAREYKLPPLLIDIIQQHHGTSLIQYFYQKAKQQENAHLHIVKEDDYSYPGPKPQTKESGIIMLADVLEAASRSVQNPTPQKMEELAHRTIHDIYNTGQLDECDLTLKNLSEIMMAFARILTSIYHSRIEYPRPDKPEKQEPTCPSILEISKSSKRFKPTA